jgi:hypothetical protein
MIRVDLCGFRKVLHFYIAMVRFGHNLAIFQIAIGHYSVHASCRERVKPVSSGRQDLIAGPSRARVKTGRKRRVFPP